MASLAEQLKKNARIRTRGPGGVLQEDSVEEVQSLANKAGIVPPTTAVGGALLGATPDQQKMLGTPANVTSSVRQSLAPQENLADVTRTAQARTQLTAEEQQKQGAAQQISGLGSLGARVNSLVDAQRAKLAAAETPVQVQAVDQAQVAGQQQDLTGLKPLLTQLRADPTNQQLQLQLNQALGRNVNSTISPEEINNMYQSSVEAIAGGAGQNIDQQLTVSDLAALPEGLGSTIPELSQLLGVPEADLANYSVGQFRDAIAAARDAEFNKSQELLQKSGSGLLGSAERQQARALGREQSATGIRSIEQSVQNLESQIQNADQVSFGGKSYNVDELLSDAGLSGIITDYMQAAPGSPERAELERTEPGLIQFINKNQEVLAEAAKQLSTGAQTFQDIQTYNQQLTQGLESLPEDILGNLVPGVGQLAAGKLTGEESLLARELVDTASDPKSREAVVQSANTIFGQFPELANLEGVDPASFSAMMRDPAKAQAEVNKLKEVNRLLTIQDPRDLATVLTGGKQGPAQIAEQVRENAIDKALGFGSSDSVTRFDSNGDGIIDSLDVVRSNSGIVKPDTASFFAGNTSVPKMGEALAQDPNRLTAAQKNVRAVLSSAGADGRITADELEGPYSYDSMKNADFGASLNRAAELQELAKTLKSDPKTMDTLQGKLNQVRDLNTTKAFNGIQSSIDKAATKINEGRNSYGYFDTAINDLGGVVNRIGSGLLSDSNAREIAKQNVTRLLNRFLRMEGYSDKESENYLKTGQATSWYGNKATTQTVAKREGLDKLRDLAKKLGMV